MESETLAGNKGNGASQATAIKELKRGGEKIIG